MGSARLKFPLVAAVAALAAAPVASSSQSLDDNASDA